MDQPITSLKGIGSKTEKLFQTLGIYTVGDLLHNYPRGYEQFPPMCALDEIEAGNKWGVYLRVPRSPVVQNTSRMEVTILEVSGREKKLRLIWYRTPYIRAVVKAGGQYVFYGMVTEKNGILTMQQPEVLSRAQYEERCAAPRPVYGLTRGLSNNQMQKALTQAITGLDREEDYLSPALLRRQELMNLPAALRNIHFPQDEQQCILARRRLVFDEFFLFILAMQQQKNRQETKNPFIFSDTALVSRLEKQLPYALTGAQKKCLEEIRADMRGATMMQRLIQGDVGSGKTILAFFAMLDCAANGYQSAMMAPTEVLARQHAAKLAGLCREWKLDYPVILLTGSLTARERREAYEAILAHPSALIIGTHALIQEKVSYPRLALVITDEQHRFGVRQREVFALKGAHPHILVMSATPIPRTLAIILYGDLSLSVIDEVPARRKPIKNCVVTPAYRNTAYRFMENQVRLGHQVYVICPLVEESELSEGENVLDYRQKLEEIFPPEITIGALHGRMRPEEKNRIMEDFLANRIQILVSTTVIEVGVDVPNATVMLIEDAQRFGLAQLHQLRGRVGRGEAQSYCIFMQGKESKEKNPRLEILNQSNDGFAIAAEDLKLRGPGDFFGIRQSGEFGFRLADIYQDAPLIEAAAKEVVLLLNEDPQLETQENRKIQAQLRRYLDRDLAQLSL